MFTSAKTREIAKEIEAALKAIGAKHGFEVPAVDLRRARGDGFARLMKADFYPKSTQKTATSSVKPASNDFKINMGMKAYGIEKTANNKGDTLVGYNSNCPKYCFTYRSARGTMWKITPDQAKRRFA